MITKERLEELIEQKAIIYCLIKKPFIGFSSYTLEITPIVLDNSYGISVEEYNKQNNCKSQFYKFEGIYYNICDADNIYETKEEAEFVQKFHTSKTVYFEPPTWEEFLKTETDDGYPYLEIQKLAIIMQTQLKCFCVTDNWGCVWESFSYTDENKKQKYYEAVEYAKKIFLGE